MPFSGIRGQDSAIRCLKNAIELDRVAHAYIFFGPEGVGKRKTAIAFAKVIAGIETLAHPDVILISPEEGSKTVKIDQVRRIISAASLKPYGARKKVYIIDEAHEMEEEASNALLKTFEEPPADTVIILVTQDLDRLAPTIRSRGQVVRFFALGTDLTEKILKDEAGVDPLKAHILARASGGRIGKAIDMANAAFFKKRSEILDGLAGGTFFDSEFERLTRTELEMYMDVLVTWYRDVLVSKASGRLPGDDGKSLLVNIDRQDQIEGAAAEWDFESLEGVINQIEQTNLYLDAHINAKLAMAVIGIKASAGRHIRR